MPTVKKKLCIYLMKLVELYLVDVSDEVSKSEALITFLNVTNDF